MTSNQTTNLYSQCLYARPLSEFEFEAEHTAERSSDCYGIRQIFLLLHLENIHEARHSDWLEANQNLREVQLDQIPSRILFVLESRYKNLFVSRNEKTEVRLEVYKMYLQTLSEFRKKVGQQSRQRVLIHYVSRSNLIHEGLIMIEDELSRQPVCVNVSELSKLINEPVIFIFDCNGSGRLCEALERNVNAIGFAACSSSEVLISSKMSQNCIIPEDIFSICMTDPLFGLSIMHIYENQIKHEESNIRCFQQLVDYYSEKIKMEEAEEILYYIRLITECLAFNYLPEQLFEDLQRSDDRTLLIVENYFAAERVMNCLGLQTVSTLNIPDLSKHHLWVELDNIMAEFYNDDCSFLATSNIQNNDEMSLKRVESFNDMKEIPIYTQQSSFSFEADQIESFLLQIRNLKEESFIPDNLTIIISLCRKRAEEQECLSLLCEFVDLCPSALKILCNYGFTFLCFNLILNNKSNTSNSEENSVKPVKESTIKPSNESIVFNLACFILIKILSYDLIEAQKYIDLIGSKINTSISLITDILEKRMFDEFTSLLATELLTILTSSNLNKLLKSVTSESENTNDPRFEFVNNLRKHFLEKLYGMDIIDVRMFSNNHNEAFWTILLFGNLVSQYPRTHFIKEEELRNAANKTTFKISETNEFAEDFIKYMNDESCFYELESKIAEFIELLKISTCPEIRSSAARAISNCFLDLKHYESIKLPLQNAYEKFFDSELVKELCECRNDQCVLVRYEMTRAISKLLCCYLNSAVKEYSRLMKLSFKIVEKEDETDFFITHLLHSLQEASVDPYEYISLAAASVLNNLKEMAFLKILEDTTISARFIIYGEQELLSENLSNNEIFGTSTSLISYKEIAYFKDVLKHHKKFIYNDFLEALQDESGLIEQQNIDSKLGFESFKASLNLSFVANSMKDALVSSEKLSIESEESDLDYHYIESQSHLRTNSKLEDEECNDLLLQQENSELPSLMDEKFSFLKKKHELVTEYDKLLLEFGFSFYISKLEHSSLVFESAILNFAIFGLEEEEITENVVELAIIAASKVHRYFESCNSHHLCVQQDDGCRSSRLFEFQCEVCENIVRSGTQQLINGEIISSVSSIQVFDFKLIKSLFGKQKDIFDRSSRFVPLISLCLTEKEDLPKKFSEFLDQIDHSDFYELNFQEKSIEENEVVIGEQYISVNVNCINEMKAKLDKDIPEVCECFAFSLPISNTKSELQESNIPLLFEKDREDLLNKEANYSLNTWDMVFSRENFGSENQEIIISDGWLSEKIEKPYWASIFENIFCERELIIEVLANNIDSQKNDSVFGLGIAFGIVDQSCNYCRLISVRKELLEEVFRAVHHESSQLLKYYPTRDVRPLVVEQTKKKSYFTKKEIISDLEYEDFTKEILNKGSSPFLYIDENMFCEKNSGLMDHAQLSRCLYRICTNSSDILISEHIVHNGEEVNENMTRLYEKKWITTEERKFVCSYMEDCKGMSESNKEFEENRPNYSSKRFENDKYFININGPTNEVFQPISVELFPEEVEYLEEEMQSYASNEINGFSSYPNKIFSLDVISNIKKPEIIKFHPKQSFFVISGEEGLYVNNYDLKMNCNTLSKQFVNNFSASSWPGQQLCHHHTEFKYNSNAPSMEELFRKYDSDPQGILYGKVLDNEISSQHCGVCQAIKIANGELFPGVNPDRLDAFLAEARSTTSSDDLCLYRQPSSPQIMHKVIAETLGQTPDDRIIDINFLNVNQPNDILAASGSNGTFRIFSNPFDVGCTRQVTAYQIFERERPFQFNPISSFQALDCLRRLSYSSPRFDRDLLQMYVSDKLELALNRYQCDVGATPGVDVQRQYLTSVGIEQSVFSCGNKLKILDLVSERFSLDIITKNNVSSLLYDEYNSRVLFGDFSGQLVSIDVRDGKEIIIDHELHSVPLSISALKDQIHVGYNSGIYKMFSKDKEFSSRVGTSATSVECLKNLGAFGSSRDGKGILSLEMVNEPKLDIKLDRFQKFHFNEEMNILTTINDETIRIYGVE